MEENKKREPRLVIREINNGLENPDHYTENDIDHLKRCSNHCKNTAKIVAFLTALFGLLDYLLISNMVRSFFTAEVWRTILRILGTLATSGLVICGVRVTHIALGAKRYIDKAIKLGMLGKSLNELDTNNEKQI